MSELVHAIMESERLGGISV